MIEVETMWAIEREDGHEIDNIPFYVQSIALGDLVAAVPGDGGMLEFSRVTKSSGHSTVRLWFAREEDVSVVREELKRMGCSSEISNLSRLVAVDVPPTVSYAKVKAFLDEGEAAERFEYEEGCLGQEPTPTTGAD